jgi:RES domain-containing protein
MLTGDALRRALRRVELVRIRGPWVRAIDAHLVADPPPGSAPGARPDPLWAGGARLFGARFTPKGGFDTLYLASDLVTVAREIGAMFPSGEVAPTKDPFTVVHVTGTLAGVLDLTRPEIVAQLRTTPDELAAPWRLVRSAPTHRLGSAAFRSGRVSAIRCTSSKHPQGTITAVFVDRLASLPPSHLECVDATGRLSRRLPASVR